MDGGGGANSGGGETINNKDNGIQPFSKWMAIWQSGGSGSQNGHRVKSLITRIRKIQKINTTFTAPSALRKRNHSSHVF